MAENTKESDVEKFHGFSSPSEALRFYYFHELKGRHPEGYEFWEQKKLLEWLATQQ